MIQQDDQGVQVFIWTDPSSSAANSDQVELDVTGTEEMWLKLV